MPAGPAQMMLYSVFVREKFVTFLTRPNKRDLDDCVRPVVDRCFGLDERRRRSGIRKGSMRGGRRWWGAGSTERDDRLEEYQ